MKRIVGFLYLSIQYSMAQCNKSLEILERKIRVKMYNRSNAGQHNHKALFRCQLAKKKKSSYSPIFLVEAQSNVKCAHIIIQYFYF